MRCRSVILLLPLLAGCTPQAADPARFYGGPLSPEELVGCWVITEDSLPHLHTVGFAKYTNRLDHVLLLNGDGTCVYRSFTEFTPDWFKEGEEKRFNRFAGERGRAPWGEETLMASRSWYRWNAEGVPAITGPFTNTYNAVTAAGVVLPNCWDRWRLADSGSDVRRQFELDDAPGGSRFRYKVEFRNHVIDSNLSWFVSKDQGRLYLWQPAITRPGDAGWATRDRVRFEKVDLGQWEGKRHK